MWKSLTKEARTKRANKKSIEASKKLPETPKKLVSRLPTTADYQSIPRFMSPTMASVKHASLPSPSTPPSKNRKSASPMSLTKSLPTEKALPSPPVAQVAAPASPIKRTILDASERPLRRSPPGKIGEAVSEDWPVLVPEPASPASIDSVETSILGAGEPHSSTEVMDLAQPARQSFETVVKRNAYRQSTDTLIIVHQAEDEMVPRQSSETVVTVVPRAYRRSTDTVVGVLQQVPKRESYHSHSSTETLTPGPYRGSAGTAGGQLRQLPENMTSTIPEGEDLQFYTPETQKRPSASELHDKRISKDYTIIHQVPQKPVTVLEDQEETGSLTEQTTTTTATEPEKRVSNGEFTVKRLSAHMPEYGPTLTVSQSADSVVLGPDRNAPVTEEVMAHRRIPSSTSMPHGPPPNRPPPVRPSHSRPAAPTRPPRTSSRVPVHDYTTGSPYARKHQDYDNKDHISARKSHDMGIHIDNKENVAPVPPPKKDFAKVQNELGSSRGIGSKRLQTTPGEQSQQEVHVPIHQAKRSSTRNKHKSVSYKHLSEGKRESAASKTSPSEKRPAMMAGLRGLFNKPKRAPLAPAQANIAIRPRFVAKQAGLAPTSVRVPSQVKRNGSGLKIAIPPRPRTSRGPIDHPLTPMTTTPGIDSLVHEMVQLARIEQNMVKKQHLVILSKAMMDSITNVRDAQRAAEEAKIAATRAEEFAGVTSRVMLEVAALGREWINKNVGLTDSVGSSFPVNNSGLVV